MTGVQTCALPISALLGGVIGGAIAGGGYGYGGYGGYAPYVPYGGYYNCVPRPIYDAWGRTVGYAAC